MSLHEKERNKKMPTPRHKVTHNPIPTSLFSVRGFKSRNLIGPFPDVYSRIVRKLLNIIRKIRSRIVSREDKKNKWRFRVRNATFSLGGSERPREDTNDGLTSILTVTFDKPSSLQDGLERRSSGFFSHTSYHCFCRSVRSGRATAASLLALPYCATSREAEVGSPRPSDSRISSERVRCRPRFLSCVCF